MPSPEPVEGQPLGRDLERIFKRKGLWSEAVSSWVIARANQMGKGRFQATTFRDGVLTCLAGSLPVAELQLTSHKFREAINKKFGREVVKTIRFKQQ